MAEKIKNKLKRFIGRIGGYFPTALPIGTIQFDAFCSHIFFVYDIPDYPSYREAIGTMILHQSPTTHKKALRWFERSIRKAQANQVAFEAIQQAKQRTKEMDEGILQAAKVESKPKLAANS